MFKLSALSVLTLLALTACEQNTAGTEQSASSAKQTASQAATAQTSDPSAQCAALNQASIYRTQISKTEWIEKGRVGDAETAALTGAAGTSDTLRPHCLVEGEIEARTGVNDKHYGIRFQLRLPADWNGKFLFQGGGGMDGVVGDAIGSIPIRGSTATPALQRGYAVVTTDSGHQGGDTAFAEDQQARLDYAYAAIGKVVQVGKQLISQHYADAPKHTYYMGCSNGGRGALMAAQRFPIEFDGVVVTNPGFRLSRAAVAEAWDNQQFLKHAPTNDSGEKIFANALTQEDLEAVKDGLLARCDALDGLPDGIVNAWEKCDFKPEMVADKIGQSKVDLLNAVFNGAKDSQGNALYSGWFYDTGIATAGWRRWKLGDSQTATPNAVNTTMGAAALSHYFSSPAQPDLSAFDVDFDQIAVQTAQTAAINDAVATDFSTFNARGGKMILVTGVSDPVFSALDQRDWYQQLLKDMSNANFSKFFAIPGLTHCGGGAGLQNVDPLTALEQWREQGKEPQQLLASGKINEVEKSQPICAYPKIAMYKGGDENKAESFVCE